MKDAIDQSLRAKGSARRNVKLGVGGIREVEFLVQALQLLYGGDDPWLRERNSLRAIFRLTERGYLSPGLGRFLGDALVHLRTVEHRLQILHEFQTHTLPGGRGGARAARAAHGHRPAAEPPRAAASSPSTGASPAACTGRFASSSRRRPPPPRPGPHPELHRAQGHRLRRSRSRAPDPAPGGRGPAAHAVPGRRAGALTAHVPGAARRALAEPDPDQALNQFERLVAAAGPRIGVSRPARRAPRSADEPRRLCARGELVTQMLIAQPELLTGLADPATSRAPKGERELRPELSAVLAPRLTAAERTRPPPPLKQAASWRSPGACCSG